MTATTFHPARAVMDQWRTTTPRPILRVVRTVRDRDANGNTEYRAYIGMVRVTEQRDYSLTESENHLAVALSAVWEYRTGSYRLVDFTLTDDKAGTFVLEQV
jgi:hypothetical protein